ncbi:MAG TPA: MbnP family copper-binding protein [Polyangiaceae bacterium]
MRPSLSALLLLAMGIVVSGCRDAQGAKARVASFAFVATWQGAPLRDGRGASSPEVEVIDARLFVHDVRIVDDRGVETPVSLAPDGAWQTDRVALLDFAAATEGGREGRAGHGRLVVRIPDGAPPAVALRFRLGVPFRENHADPAVATAPLSVGSMSWGWNAGYKFLRLEGRTAEGPFAVHVGSTGCEGTFGHVTRCARPNRAEIEVPLEDERPTALDLAELAGAGTRCMGAADEPACAPVFDVLGLDAATGESHGTSRLWTGRRP